MTKSQRQHGIGSLAPDEKIVGKPGGIVEAGVKQYGIFKKIKKIGKKVLGSKLGKAALIGASLYGLNQWGPLAGKISPMLSGGWTKFKGLGFGKQAMLGLGAAGIAAPFFAGKGDDEEEESDWSVTPSSIANIRLMARNRDPSLAFLPPADSVQSGYYLANGGVAGLANGGGAANAQAEQMLKAEYQKYRNQGGTMSYQQFKMAVLQQAQAQGPVAQGQPQAQGFANGELVEDASMIEETPTGMMEENVEEVQGEPTREQMEALAMEIFQLRLEELDEEQLMIVYQAAMEQQPEEVAMQEEDIQFDPQMAAPQMAANGGRIRYGLGSWLKGKLGLSKVGRTAYASSDRSQDPSRTRSRSLALDLFRNKFNDDDDEEVQFAANGGIMGSHVPGYTTPPGYNRFDYPSGGVRVGRAEGGIMDLGGMEKDYRAEGGFVPIAGKEKADDVPARLSKNEFVFTADAVRNAGGGDIDAGAEVMQNMMENLESGGQISEESQGGGGEEMISEEEIIEAPNGAQEMYDQQAMLESRMA